MKKFEAELLPAYEITHVLQAIWLTAKDGKDRWVTIMSCCCDLIMEPMRGVSRYMAEEYVKITLETIKKTILKNLERWDVKP